MIGSFLLHYRILHQLGSGGMGEVYAAEDTRLNRRVALKLLSEDMARDPDRLQRFRREAQAVAALNHPNVVTIYAVEEADGVPFLTMEIVDGQTLGSQIPSGGLAWREFFKWAIPLVDAIAAAHQHGVIHRDIKPANVMIGAGDRLKVLDFGLAKLHRMATGEATVTATAPHVVIGTAAYMSPEQAEGKPIDARSDIFSLGVVLYEMASGVRPFKGDSAMSILSSILKDTAQPLSDNRPDVPADLDRIVRRCLAKDPARRYQTAIDLRNDLEDLQQQHASGVRAGAATGAVSARSRSWAAYWPVALAAALVAIAAGGFSAWRGRSPAAIATPLRVSFNELTSAPGIEWFPSLSADGRWVVYAGDAAGNRDIYLQSVGGQNPINLTKDSLDDDDQPAMSPDGEKIVFRSSRQGGGLFIMGRTGEALNRLTSAGFRPAWSPDGATIAYSTESVDVNPQNAYANGGLWIVDVGSGKARDLQIANAAQASFSPDGKRIAVTARHPDARQMDIVSVTVDGGGLTTMVTGPSFDWNPVWSPDGRFLYFSSDRAGSMNLWRVPVDMALGEARGEPEPVTAPTTFAAHPSMSASGGLMVFTSVTTTQNVARLDLDPSSLVVKGEPADVTTGSRAWSSPDPSPDGQWVTFYSSANPEGDIYVARTDGTSLRQLTSDAAADRVPRWSPDGNWIAFFSNRAGPYNAWMIHADGSGLQQAVDVPGGAYPTWSPDGSRMAVSTGLLGGTVVRGAIVFDAHRPWKEQKRETLPAFSPTDSFAPNSWSPDGQTLAGQVSLTPKGIATYSFRSGTFERLTDFGEFPVWLPDSRRILFASRGREFLVVDTVTRQVRTIYTAARGVFGPPRLTRDGRAAYFTRRITESDIWMVQLQN